MMKKHINPEIGLAYLNDRLDAAQKVKLEQHLAQCAACVRELNEHRRVHEAFQMAAEEQVVPRPERPSWYALQAEKEGGNATRPTREMPWRVVLAGVVALFVALVWVVGGPSWSQEVEPAADVVLTRPLEPDVVTATPTVESEVVEPVVLATAMVVAEAIETDDEVAYSRPFVSAAGRLAFSVGGVTYVEDVPQSGIYLEAGRELQIISWARDVDLLLLHRHDPLLNVNYSYLSSFYIWDAAVGVLVPVADRFESAGAHTIWDAPLLSPDGQQIWFNDFLSPYFFVVDLLDGSTTQLTLGHDFPSRTFTVNEEGVVLLAISSDCGALCHEIRLYDSDQGVMHELGRYSSGYAVFPEVGAFGYVTGLDDGEIRIHRIDLTTFGTEVIGSVAPDAIWRYRAGEATRPHISPTGSHLAFEVDEDVWEMMDSEGRSFGRQESATILDWRRGGGPVLAQETPEGLTQLVYWEPDYQKFPRVFVLPRAFNFVWGEWDEQGDLFVYLAQDETAEANYLYAWRPEVGAPELIHAVSMPEKLSDLVWLPDGRGFYFKQGDQLWVYRLDEGAARPIVIENR